MTNDSFTLFRWYQPQRYYYAVDERAGRLIVRLGIHTYFERRRLCLCQETLGSSQMVDVLFVVSYVVLMHFILT